jgi:hypothetical protein
MTEDYLKATEQEMRGAKFLVEQIDACGDNTDKKIRLVAMIMHQINGQIEEHKKLTLEIYQALPKKSRGRDLCDTLQKRKRSRSRMDKTKPCEGLGPGLTPGGIAT